MFSARPLKGKPDPADDEQPIMSVALQGFDAAQRRAVTAGLARPRDVPAWSVSAVADADALFVNGANCALTPDRKLHVRPGSSNEDALTLDMGEVHRPVAFSLPLATQALEPRCTFAVSDPASIRSVLEQFDRSLRQVRSMFALGRQITERERAVRGGVFHVLCADQLLAVLNFRTGAASISPAADPAHVEQAQWSKRPLGAGAVPAGFVSTSAIQLQWSHARRTARDLLPDVYRYERIHFQREPLVPLRWLRDSHLVLLRELYVQPNTFAALVQRTGLAPVEAARALASLHYAGAITVDEGKAAPSVTGASPRLTALLASVKPAAADLTAPAVLKNDLLHSSLE